MSGLSEAEADQVGNLAERIRTLAARLERADRAEFVAILDSIEAAAQIDRAEGRQ